MIYEEIVEYIDLPDPEEMVKRVADPRVEPKTAYGSELAVELTFGVDLSGAIRNRRELGSAVERMVNGDPEIDVGVAGEGRLRVTCEWSLIYA